jgi:UDP-N-acetylglucosamine--N-acetylmuramyl-(pentapeptide) pyrophosphoryl-undecaprenol N-acetylglucosamine transferase
VVIGTGGFASGPLLQVAAIAGIPIVIQEQNSYPGITNKLLANKAKRICVAYENLDRFFPKNKIVVTGNPVRSDLIDIEARKKDAVEHYGLDPDKKTLLILGGSLGARNINRLIAKELVGFSSQNIQVIWQCGKLYFEEYTHFSDSPNVQVVAFIERMDYAYAAADFIISRAGASSVSELCIVGKPVIFIPSPNVAEDHQTKNAKAVSDKEAAILIKESELDTKFNSTFNNLINDSSLQQKLRANIRTLAKKNATQDIADEIIKLIQTDLKS